VTDSPDLVQARAVLHGFDVGPLPPLDVDDVVRRGHRRRRVVLAQRSAAVLVVVLAAAAGIASVQSRAAHTPTPAATASPTTTPSPTPSPTTVAERIDVVMAAVAAAGSVHVVTQLGGGMTLDVVVTEDGAHGTLTRAGKTSEYLGVDGAKGRNGAVYVKADALAGSYLSAEQASKAHGRWVFATGVSPLNRYMNLLALSQSFYPTNGITQSLGRTRTINGVPTIAIVSGVKEAGAVYVEIGPPYRPVFSESARHVLHGTFSDWDAPVPKLPPAPAAADIYRPFG